MSSVVLIVSIPTEDHEKCLLKKAKKKKVVIEEKPEILGSRSDQHTLDFEHDFGFIGSKEFVFPNSAKKEEHSMEHVMNTKSICSLGEI